MKKNAHTIVGIASSGLALAAMGAGVAGMAVADTSQTALVQPAVMDAAAAEVAPTQQVRTEPVVEGTFAYTQSEVTPTEAIARAMGSAPDVLCGAQGGTLTDVAAEDWTISVGGAVSDPYSATVAELQADTDVQSVLMGCACAGNPADGIAQVNARVTGVAVRTLLDKAGVSPEANTITFASADGYEVSLPLYYVTQRLCPIVFDVNGSPIEQTMGGTNQLWLGSTSARYFARNIVSITVEARDEAPAAPGTEAAGDTYANLPNVGVAFGGEVA